MVGPVQATAFKKPDPTSQIVPRWKGQSKCYFIGNRPFIKWVLHVPRKQNSALTWLIKLCTGAELINCVITTIILVTGIEGLAEETWILR